MEFTKDVIFNIKYADSIGRIKIKNKKWTSSIMEVIKQNKFVISILTSLVGLISIDIILVNSFINILRTF